MNDEEDAEVGADNLIGTDKDKQLWYNPTHGFIGDGLETLTDMFGNSLGHQTGISRQAEEYQENNREKNLYLHSQAHTVFQEGARNTQNGHTYNSYGAPTSENSVEEAFISDEGKPPEVYRDPKDPVSNPWPNIFIPSNYQYHGTENYGILSGVLKGKKND